MSWHIRACQRCHGDLYEEDHELVCLACGARYIDRRTAEALAARQKKHRQRVKAFRAGNPEGSTRPERRKAAGTTQTQNAA